MQPPFLKLYVIQKFVVKFLVDQTSDYQQDEGVCDAKQVNHRRGNHTINYNATEVIDVNVDGVEVEKLLILLRHDGDGVEDCGGIVEQGQEDTVQILHISEENIQRREDHPDADKADEGTQNRI